jgi:hypothetical protein
MPPHPQPRTHHAHPQPHPAGTKTGGKKMSADKTKMYQCKMCSAKKVWAVHYWRIIHTPKNCKHQWEIVETDPATFSEGILKTEASPNA